MQARAPRPSTLKVNLGGSQTFTRLHYWLLKLVRRAAMPFSGKSSKLCHSHPMSRRADVTVDPDLKWDHDSVRSHLEGNFFWRHSLTSMHKRRRSLRRAWTTCWRTTAQRAAWRGRTRRARAPPAARARPASRAARAAAAHPSARALPRVRRPLSALSLHLSAHSIGRLDHESTRYLGSWALETYDCACHAFP